jgi:hypothetical protein
MLLAACHYLGQILLRVCYNDATADFYVQIKSGSRSDADWTRTGPFLVQTSVRSNVRPPPRTGLNRTFLALELDRSCSGFDLRIFRLSDPDARDVHRSRMHPVIRLP